MIEEKTTQSDITWSIKCCIQLENIRKLNTGGMLISNILEYWTSYNFLCPDMFCYDKRLAGLVGKTSLHIVYKLHNLCCINFMLQ